MAKKGSFSKVYDKNGDYVDVEAARFDGTRTFQMQGDVSASQTWNGDPSSPLTLNASIGAKKVTQDKIGDKAVGSGQMADGSVGLPQMSASAMNGTVQDNDSKLATHAAVKTYVDAQISGQGTYLGKHTVAEINAFVTDNLHNGDRVIVSDSGTINLGPGGQGFDVVAGEDLILYKQGSTVQWDSMDGNFKTKQSAVTKSGTALKTVTAITQNANGEVDATFTDIQSASTSQAGVVQLNDATNSTSTTQAATANSVKKAYDHVDTAIAALDAEKTSSDGTNVQVKVTEVDGKVTAVNVTTDNTENKNNKVSSWSSTTTDNHYPSEKLVKDSLDTKADKVSGATSGNFAGLDANGNLTDSGSKAADFATAAQGSKADSAVQGVKLDGASSALTPDANKVVTIPNAAPTGTGETNGLMTAADKAKLNGITSGANKVEASNTNGNIKIDGTETNVYTHPSAGPSSATSVGDTTNQTPAFGGTFKAISQTVNTDGHTTDTAEHTVTLPTDGKDLTSTVSTENNYTNPGSTATALKTLFGKIWNFIGRLRTSWQTTPDDSHFPSEKLVKDSLDAKVTGPSSATADGIAVFDGATGKLVKDGGKKISDLAQVARTVAIADCRVQMNGHSGWYNVASATFALPGNNFVSSWLVTLYATNSSFSAETFIVNLSIRQNSGANPVVYAFNAECINKSSKNGFNANKFKVVVEGTSSLTIELWYSPGATTYGSMILRELNAGQHTGVFSKSAWTYHSISNVAGEGTEPTGTVAELCNFIYAKNLQTAVTDPTASGTALSFIDSITQNANGEITPTKKTVSDATTSEHGLMSATDKTKLNGIAEGAEVNVQADWNQTNSSADDFIKNKPIYKVESSNALRYIKTCSLSLTETCPNGIVIVTRHGSGSVLQELLHKNGSFSLFCKKDGNIGSGSTARPYYVVSNNKVDIYLRVSTSTVVYVSPLANLPKNEVNFTDFGTVVESLPEGATEILRIWVANSNSSSGTAPVKVDAYGALTPVPMDSTPTASSTNLMTSGDIKTALDGKVDGYKRVGASASSADSNQHNWQKLLDIKLKGWSRYSAILFSNLQDTVPSGMIILNVSRLADGNGAPTSISVDTLGRTEQNPNSRQWAYSYDSISNSTIVYTHSRYTPDPAFRLLYEFNSNPSVTVSWFSSTDSTTVPASSTEFNAYEHAKHLKGSTVGSTSVPAYVKSTGELAACTDDFVHDGDVAQTYSSTSEAPISGKGMASVFEKISYQRIPIGNRFDNVKVFETNLTPWLCYEISDIGLTASYKAATAEFVVYRMGRNSTTKNLSYRVNVHWTYATASVEVSCDDIGEEWTAVVVNSSTPSGTDVTTLKLYCTPYSYTTYRISVVSCKTRGSTNNSDGTIEKKSVVEAIPSASALVIIGTTTVKTILHDSDVKSTYSSTGTDPVNGTAVAEAIATSLTDVEYVAAQSGGGGNLNKTKNGTPTSVLAFMTTAEARSVWTNAKAAVANAS